MELLRRVRDASPDPAALRYFFTGHSLGGALTTLAAHELVQNVPDADVTVYTVRVGWTGGWDGWARPRDFAMRTPFINMHRHCHLSYPPTPPSTHGSLARRAWARGCGRPSTAAWCARTLR